MQNFPGQGSNPSHSSDNARSLITRPPASSGFPFLEKLRHRNLQCEEAFFQGRGNRIKIKEKTWVGKVGATGPPEAGNARLSCWGGSCSRWTRVQRDLVTFRAVGNRGQNQRRKLGVGEGPHVRGLQLLAAGRGYSRQQREDWGREEGGWAGNAAGFVESVSGSAGGFKPVPYVEMSVAFSKASV